jgi:hypothetical protein
MNKPNYQTPKEHRGYRAGFKGPSRHLDFRCVTNAMVRSANSEFMERFKHPRHTRITAN